MFKQASKTLFISLIFILSTVAFAAAPKPSSSSPKAQVVIKAISAQQQKTRMSQDKRWTPLDLLDDSAQNSSDPQRVDIQRKTNFYALFLDPEGRYQDQPVVFTWHYGNPLQLYGRPITKTVRRWPGHSQPAAWHSIWSQPPVSKGLLGGLGLGSVKSRADWESSRCYGPRVVRVWTLKGYQTSREGRRIPLIGRLLSEKYFAVYPRDGVTY